MKKEITININNAERKETKVLHLLLDMGEQLLNCGAEIHRVEDTLTRLAAVYGAKQSNIFVITSNIIITLIFRDGSEMTQTRRITKAGGTDLTKLEMLNELSRSCCRTPMEPEQCIKQIREIKKYKNASWKTYAGSMIGASCFAVFFGGTIFDGMLAGAMSLLICWMQRHFAPFCMNLVVFNLFTTLSVGIVICAIAAVCPVFHEDMVMIGDIMLLVPGLAMTNSIRDILLGDTISGCMRLMETLLWTGAMALGFMIAMWVVGGGML